MNTHLATPIASTKASYTFPASGEYLAFRLGGEAYGVNILGVQEIRSYEQPTRIAGCPPHVRGILELRGVSVPVLDLRVCLGLDAQFDGATVTIVINPEAAQTVGLVVDSVSDVVDLQSEQMRSMPNLQEDDPSHYIQGLACITQDGAQRTLQLLDISQLINRVKTGATAPL